VTRKRKFGGRYYVLSQIVRPKSAATDIKRQFQRRGFYVRVVPVSKPVGHFNTRTGGMRIGSARFFEIWVRKRR